MPCRSSQIILKTIQIFQKIVIFSSNFRNFVAGKSFYNIKIEEVGPFEKVAQKVVIY